MRKINFHQTDTQFKKILSSFHGYDLAQLVNAVPNENKLRILTNLDTKKLIDVFNELANQKEILELLGNDLTKTILNNLETDNLKYLIAEEDEENQKKYLSLLPPIKKKIILSLLVYDEDLAASIMTTDFIKISNDSTVKKATNSVILKSKDNDYIDSVFVVDENDDFLGEIEIKSLIIARADVEFDSLIDKECKTIEDTASIEEAIKLVKDYDLKVLPVLKNKKLIGIITQSDIFEELVDYNEETFDKLSLIHDLSLETSVWKRIITRIPWLLASVVLNLLIATFLSIFEETMIAVIALALFQPMIMGMSGNISTQSLGVTILKIQQKDLNNIQVPKNHILKEFVIGFINSLFLSVIAFLFVFFIMQFIKIGTQTPLEMGFVVGVSMFVSLLVSAFIGSYIPLLCDKLKIDPAAASGPIMSTINDLFSLFVYFGLATILFLL
ncbi:MAG: magnesium transporter [Bacillales bacterium]|jgi:magnesium transporter|nr:magnesium transporter [Bacillales bacterium]